MSPQDIGHLWLVILNGLCAAFGAQVGWWSWRWGYVLAFLGGVGIAIVRYIV